MSSRGILHRCFWLLVFIFSTIINAETLAGDTAITRGGAGVSKWANSIVAGNAAESTWSEDGGLKIDPSWLTSGTEATYRFLLPENTLFGTMTNLRVRIYGKGQFGTWEPALYAGTGSGRIQLVGSLPETEGETPAYSIPLSCLTEAEGSIPGNWLDITLDFGYLDWYDVKYVKVEYTFSNVSQSALENYQNILNVTQTLWIFYDETADNWPHPVASTDGMEATYMAVIPSYKSVFAAGDPLVSAILEIQKLPKLYQGLKSTFEEFFAFTDFMQACTVFFNTGSGNEASFAFNEMADLANEWKNGVSDNGQIDSDEISGINSCITNTQQRISNLDAKITAIGQNLKNIRNNYTDEGIRNCARAGLLLLSPMIEFNPESGNKLDGGYLPPIQNFLESIRPTTQLGSLTVTLNPSSAQWHLYGNGWDFGWRNSGVTVSDIPPEDGYTLEFSSVSGYTTPSPRQITINAGTNNQTVNYQQSGGVTRTLTPWYDTYVNQQYGTAKYYSAESLLINNTTNQKYTFIGFDLDGIPSGSTINKAELHLQYLCMDQSVIDIYKITDTVSGGNNDSISWNNQPDLGFHYGTFALPASPPSGDTREWIITCTSAIQTQVNSNDDWEFCMKINDLNSDVSFNIISSEWNFDATPGPYLYVEYTPPPADTSPPTPNPMTWATQPYAGGTSSITMVASTANDSSGVEYYFDETSGNSGGSDSGWQDSTTYTDTGLQTGTTYTYKVKARDKSVNLNETSYSSSKSATTVAVGSLQVTITPQAVVNAGAKWILTGGGWPYAEYSSGQVVPDITVDTYTLEFKEIPGWQKPDSRTITISQGSNNQSGEYIIRPSINSIIPSSGPKQSYIKIEGTDFGSNLGNIDFGGTASEEIVSWSDSEIFCRVPDLLISDSPSINLVTDNFESYSVGTWPTGWDPDGNANASGNGIVADPADASNQALRLFGSIGSCWGALAYKACDLSEEYVFECDVYNGSESLSGCHPDRGYIGLRNGISWSNPSRMFLLFKGNGELIGTDSTVLGTYNTEQWYHVKIHYLRIGTSLSLSYWIDGSYLGQIDVVITDLSREESLDHIDLTVQEGSTYFDNIEVYTPDTAISNKIDVRVVRTDSVASESKPFTVTQPETIYVDLANTSGIENGSTEYPFSTIQHGIDAASDGAEVIVADGNYTGNGNRDIDFMGKVITVRSAYGAKNCIIDCQNLGRGFNFHSGEDNNSIIDGFTIINGVAIGAFGGTEDVDAGGAIRCYMSSATIRNCILSNNTATWAGTALFEYGSNTPLIVENTIFQRNGPSGAVYCYASNATPIFVNCTFANNAWNGLGSGYTEYPAEVKNCIFWNNGRNEYSTGTLFPVEITWSCVQGGYPGNGNFDQSPLFIDPANNDYHLLPDSPCIDAGDPCSDYSNEPWPNGGRINIGAYGNTIEAARSRDGLVPVGFEIVKKTRIGRTLFEYELTVKVQNQNDYDVNSVEIRLIDATDAVTSVSDDSIHIDIILSGQTVTSNDTFKVIVDSSQSIEPDRFTWELIYHDIYLRGDINGDRKIDFTDLMMLACQWLEPPGIPSADIAPPPFGDGIVNMLDFALFAENWLAGQ